MPTLRRLNEDGSVWEALNSSNDPNWLAGQLDIPVVERIAPAPNKRKHRAGGWTALRQTSITTFIDPDFDEGL